MDNDELDVSDCNQGDLLELMDLLGDEEDNRDDDISKDVIDFLLN